MTAKDSIYASPHGKVSDFSFDEAVVEVFPDMIQRSVPGYALIIETIGELTRRYALQGTALYDLGCSLGAASLSMAKGAPFADCHIVAVDNSQAMVDRCRKHLAVYKTPLPIEVVCDDLMNIDVRNASVVVMNFTLQFLPIDQRQRVIDTIYQGLHPGGILVLSEKLRHPSTAGNEALVELHHEFKRRNGYSDLEISQKRTALENVMKVDTFLAHESRLQQAGFNETVLWYKCFNFSSILAIK